MKLLNKLLLAITAIIIAAFFVPFFAQTPTLAAPPEEFEKTLLINNLNEPTSFRILNDGRILISEKSGAVKIYHDNHLNSEPLVTIGVLQTDASDERGLLGIEPDPDFDQNGYLYVAYTASNNRDRLSRITVAGDVADPESEVIFMESDQNGGIYHHGGELHFGQDGKLYWAMGDNTYNPNSQTLGNMHGKIHRLNRDGTIPTDNPFYNTPGAVKSIYAYGLRNPFRFDILPNGKLIVGDVGGAAWEEINIIEKGANYGWPNAEGTCTNCPFTNPIFTYAHTAPPASAGSISSTLFYTGTLFPTEYQNKFYYGDYTLGFIRYLEFDSSFSSVISDNVFDNDAGTIVQLDQGPDGNMYQLNFYPGQLYKISPSGGNRAPKIVATASPESGLAPLEVSFSSEGTNDPDGNEITFDWDFGDESSHSAEPNPTHIYSANGTYQAALTVSDGDKTSSITIPVTVGNRAPIASIISPITESKYNAGDTITYSGGGLDPEDGQLPDSAFEWNFYFHHADHIHPWHQKVIGSKTGTISIDRDPHNSDTTWYEIKLTVTDEGGLRHTTITNIKPNLIQTRYETNTPEATFTLDGIPHTSSLSIQEVVGVERVLSVPSPQYIGEESYNFINWEHGGEKTQTIRITNTPTTYRAILENTPLPPAPWESSDLGSRTQQGETRYENGVFTIKGGGNDIWGLNDEMRYVYQPLQENGEIIARVDSQSPTDPWSKSGIMIKESATEGAKYVMLAVTPEHGIVMQHNFNGNTGPRPELTAPTWLKLTRYGNVFTGYYSEDGSSWNLLGTTTLSMNPEATIGLFVSAHTDPNLCTTTFSNVSVRSGITRPVAKPWTSSDIGNPTLSGSAVYGGGIFTVKAGGNDIWGDTDQFHFVHQTLQQDGEIVAKIKSQANTDDWAKSGVMIKETAQEGSSYYLTGITPTNGIISQYNFTGSQNGGSYNPETIWLKVKREGHLFTSYKSIDGITWTQIGQTTIQMTGPVEAGIFATAHSANSLVTAEFQNVSLIDTPESGTLPAGWLNTDIGTPHGGSTTFYNDTFTVNGGGNDIWENTDEHHFAYKDLTGDGEIVARITSQENTSAWAKSGVMIKETAEAGSNYVLLGITPENGLVMQHNFTQSQNGGEYNLPYAWVKLKRQGDTFTSYKSIDGSNWVEIATATVPLNIHTKAGIFTSSHNGEEINTSTFDNVFVNTILPPVWEHQDIGEIQHAGSVIYDNGIYTIKGAGRDVWGTTDEMHLVHQPLIGDGSITARILSQDNTSDWAKAGIIIKESTNPGSPYTLLSVTPENGLVMQHTHHGNVSAGSFVFPTWIRIVRNGNTFSSYSSLDGENWNLIATKTIAMNSNAITGLFVNSHNASSLGTASFDNVTVSNPTIGTLPLPWLSTDVGNPTLHGKTTHLNGVFTLKGLGSDIWGNDDQFHYAYQPLEGDGSITARILSQANTHSWAKAGIMIKESPTALSPYLLFGITPDNGLTSQYNFTDNKNGMTYTLPLWLRLTRTGNTITSYTSTDGLFWTPYQTKTVTIGTNATTGLFVTSHNGSAYSQVQFDSVTIPE